jgi:hypothetical protein
MHDPSRCTLIDTYSTGDMVGAVPEEKQIRLRIRFNHC